MPHLSKRNGIRFLKAVLLCSLLLIFLPPPNAGAHSLDMYAQTEALTVSADGLQVDWKITPGPMLASSDWDSADQDQDGQVSPQEAKAWLAPFLSQWSLTLNGQAIQDVQAKELHWPASEAALESGNDPVEVHLAAQWPRHLHGQYTLEIHNACQEPISLNWFSVTAAQGGSFSRPTQVNGRLDVTVNFGGSGAAASGNATVWLTSWDSGQPNLSGIMETLSSVASSLGTGNAPANGSLFSVPTATLTGLVGTQKVSLVFLLGAFLLSLALGSLHALTPGHGKTLVAAYLVGSHGRTRDAVFLGSIVTITHTGSVLIFGLLTLLASRYIFPTLITPWLEIISGLAVIGFGLSLLVARGRALHRQVESHRAERRISHIPPLDSFHAQPGHDHHHPYSLGEETHVHFYSGNPSEAAPGLAPPHPHSHGLEAGQVTWKSLLTLGISGGLVPCPDAIAILVVAVALNRIPLGMLLIVAFSLGLAAVLIGIGIAMVQGARFIKSSASLNRFSLYTPLLSAVIVSGLGIGLTASALHALQISSAALAVSSSASTNHSSQAKPPTSVFDIKQAHLVYLSQDGQGADQLSMLPLAGGTPATYTQAAYGLNGFTVSPDDSTILYSIFNPNDGSTGLWAIGPDGSHPRLVLNCPQSLCDQPVWYPGSQKVVYQRSNYSDTAVLPIATIWWLDLATGATRPVFQDQAFPAYAPAFSPDGQWLSYFSPSTSLIELFNLWNGQTLSIPISNQTVNYNALWSPLEDSLLFWEPVDAQTGSAMHTLLEDLASGRKVDLGGAPRQSDYIAAWSPDGRWIAIQRDGPDSTNTNIEEELWLVHPDGSAGHRLFEAPGAYSDFRWSPDSRYLVYTHTPIQANTEPEIWLADIQSGRLTKILTGGLSPDLLP